MSGLYAESEPLCEIWTNRRTQAQVRRHRASELTRLSRPLEHLHQRFAVDPVAFGLADMVDNDRASLAARLAATALLLRFEVGELAGLQVTGISRFRDWPTALG